MPDPFEIRPGPRSQPHPPSLAPRREQPRPSCGSCRYMDVILSYEDDDQPEEEGLPTSICRRHPPVDGWPHVLSDDWCGEWEAA